MVVVFAVLTLRNVWAAREASHESPRSGVHDEWTETRQWGWVIAGTIIVFGVLALVSGVLLTWGEQWIGKRTFQAVVFLLFGTLMVGMGLRAGLQYKLETNYTEE